MIDLFRGGRWLALAICFAGTSVSALAADRIELRDGSVIFGTVTDADGGTVTLETEYAGTLALDYANIASMQVESDLTLQMDDGQVLQAQGLAVAEDELRLPGAASCV